MSGHAFTELEQLVRHLGDELSGFRRRALQAEARLKALDAEREARDAARAASLGAEASHPRIVELERENAELRRRLDVATARTRQMLDRVRFLRQQQTLGGER